MNEDLAALFEEDRADAQIFRGDEAFIASQARRVRVEQLLAQGAVNTAEDYFHACFIFQHGDKLENYAQAHLLARTAGDLGHPRAPYMVAASYDRWLMRQGKPQKYGTNSVGGKDGVRLWDYDPRTTDEERTSLNVPTLAELLERTKQVAQNASQSPDPPIFTAELENTCFEIFDLETSTQEEIPVYGVPSYRQVEPADPVPGYLSENLELFRFGKLFGAKSGTGQVVCTWHPASWRISSSSSGASPGQEEWAAKFADQPKWLDTGKRYWRRLSLVKSLTRCWIVGGILCPEELEKVATSLP